MKKRGLISFKNKKISINTAFVFKISSVNLTTFLTLATRGAVKKKINNNELKKRSHITLTPTDLAQEKKFSLT